MPPKLRDRPTTSKRRTTTIKKPKKRVIPKRADLNFEFLPSQSSKQGSSKSNELLPTSLNLHCRELFVGYFLRNDQGKFEQMYVDTKNNAFLVPEISMIDFQRLYLMNKWFNSSVKAYFRYLQYHVSITSRPFEKFEFKGTNRMFYDSFNNTPSPPLDAHHSVVVVFNGAIIHVFKEASFSQLRRQKLFRDTAFSLTFDGSDSTKISSKLNLFSDLKALNFQTADDMSGVYQKLLNHSFVSLRELSFFHAKFMTKLNENTVFPPNLRSLHCTTASSTIMDFNVNSYKKLLNVEVPELVVGFELLLRLNKMSPEPILLNAKIEQLTLDWTNWPYESEVSQVFSKLSMNAPHLKLVKFRKRQLQDLHAARYGFGGKRYLVAKNMSPAFFSESYIEEAIRDLDEAVRNENRVIAGQFPFKVIFELGLFLFDRRREDKVPSWKNPLDLQVVFYGSNKTAMRLMESGKQVGNEAALQIDDDLTDHIREAMEELWSKVGEPNEISRIDTSLNTFSNHMV